MPINKTKPNTKKSQKLRVVTEEPFADEDDYKSAMGSRDMLLCGGVTSEDYLLTGVRGVGYISITVKEGGHLLKSTPKDGPKYHLSDEQWEYIRRQIKAWIRGGIYRPCVPKKPTRQCIHRLGTGWNVGAHVIPYVDDKLSVQIRAFACPPDEQQPMRVPSNVMKLKSVFSLEEESKGGFKGCPLYEWMPVETEFDKEWNNIVPKLKAMVKDMADTAMVEDMEFENQITDSCADNRDEIEYE